MFDGYHDAKEASQTSAAECDKKAFFCKKKFSQKTLTKERKLSKLGKR